MAFPRDQVSDLLVRSHRRCCVCHRFCGVKIETDHILPTEQGGDDSIENAIPVCFECHAEIHSYNEKHPRGRKFTPEELRQHKAQWLKICEEHPEALIASSRVADVGPLQALIDELAFNAKIATRAQSSEQGGRFHDEEFRRAIQQGSVAILRDEIRESVLEAYATMAAANGTIQAAWLHPKGSSAWADGVNEAQRRILAAGPKIAATAQELLRFLGSEPSAA